MLKRFNNPVIALTSAFDTLLESASFFTFQGKVPLFTIIKRMTMVRFVALFPRLKDYIESSLFDTSMRGVFFLCTEVENWTLRKNSFQSVPHSWSQRE